MLKIYNTLSRRIEPFLPIQEGKASLYVCGPTVYNHIHIGNARPIIVFDMIHRYLRFKGYEVTYVQNFTDIDDKIITKAVEEKKSFQEIASYYIEKYFEDTKELNLLESQTLHPKATEYIDQMVYFVKTLIKKGHAYQVQEDVYFDVSSFPEYGALSDQKRDALQTGVRKELVEGKRSPEDFALWKGSKEGEPYWETPFGKGRPGWHLECSVMGNELLGERFDIHGGGIDLAFPHHENEIAQSHCFTGNPPVNYWMHNGFLKIDGEKMSKSLNNFRLLKEVLSEYEGSVVRLFFLQAHYRKPIDFSRDELKMTQSTLERVRNCFARVEKIENQALSPGENDELVKQITVKALEEFTEAMDSDFNTALANGVIFQWVKSMNAILDQSQDQLGALAASEAVKFLKQTVEEIFGVKLVNCGIIENDSSIFIDFLVHLRGEAKQKKDYALADEIRQFLQTQAIEIRDSKEGSEWKRSLN